MLKKEFTESIRTKKFLIIMCVFALFGIMNPAVAKLTPLLMETLQSSGMGIVITDMTVDATMSWQQFFKNMPMALIVVVIMYGGIFTSEYQRHTLTLVVTKGLARWKIVASKSVLLVTIWTVGYWMNFGITYFYTGFYWDNSIMDNLLFSAVCYWLFGLFIMAMLVFFSTLANSSGLVLLGVGMVYCLMILASMYEKIGKYLPTKLGLSMTADIVGDYIPAIIVTAGLIIAAFVSGVAIFNKKML